MVVRMSQICLEVPGTKGSVTSSASVNTLHLLLRVDVAWQEPAPVSKCYITYAKCVDSICQHMPYAKQEYNICLCFGLCTTCYVELTRTYVNCKDNVCKHMLRKEYNICLSVLAYVQHVMWKEHM